MEDHHVDRPGVEAQQCVKLTGTNSSIGLIPSRKTIARSGNARLRNTISTCVQNTYRSAAITYAPISRLTGDTGAPVSPVNRDMGAYVIAAERYVFCTHVEIVLRRRALPLRAMVFRDGIKPIELLVPVSFTHCCASTPGLSTWWSSTALSETWS